METVWKYELKLNDWTELELPLYSKILKIKGYTWQEGFSWKHRINVWVLVNPENPYKETRKFRIAGTGHPIDIHFAEYKYIDTIFLTFPEKELVFHVFEDRFF